MNDVADRRAASNWTLTIWTGFNSVITIAIGVVTAWLALAQLQLSEEAAHRAKQNLTHDHAMEIRLLHDEFRLLDAAFRQGPATAAAVDELLQRLRPIRQELEVFAGCIVGELCLSDSETKDRFCSLAEPYESTVRAWLRDLERFDEIERRTYQGLYAHCEDRP